MLVPVRLKLKTGHPVRLVSCTRDMFQIRLRQGQASQLGGAWIQEDLPKQQPFIRCVDALMNWADLGTKSLDVDSLESLVRQLPRRREGATRGDRHFCIAVPRTTSWSCGWSLRRRQHDGSGRVRARRSSTFQRRGTPRPRGSKAHAQHLASCRIEW